MGKRIYSRMSVEELSTAVNLVKSENSGVFKVEDIRKGFKTLKVPMYSELATTLVQQGIIVLEGLSFVNGYVWASHEPIHINKVTELMKMTRKRVSAQAKKYSQKKRAIKDGTWNEPAKQPKEVTPVEADFMVEPVMEHKELVPVDKAINKAIKLLIEHGYRVTKPVLIYEEVTIKSIER